MAPVYKSLSPDSSREPGLAVAALLALGAALYLTLMPFDLRPMPLTDAWAIYTRQTFSIPDAGTRQQWIANVLMFVPLGFFWTLWIVSRARSIVPIFAVIVVSLLALTVTALVEFLQVWMPYRAASIVDMSANFLGGIIGAIVGAVFGERLWRSAVALWTGERSLSREHLLLVYCFTYVFVLLFPFDFPWSVAELQQRFAVGRWAAWVSPQSCNSGAQCFAVTMLKPLFAVPVGVWIGTCLIQSRSGGKAVAVLAAVVIGLTLEFLQLLLYSGVADGRSALLHVLGLVAGVLLAERFSAQLLHRARERWGLVLVLFLTIPYSLAVVGLVTGYSDYHWSLARAFEQFQSLSLFPFYYHYFVADAGAARSVLYQIIAYAPVGVLVWLATSTSPASQSFISRNGWIAGGLALVLALTAETLKLFVSGLRPDPTNLLIAALVAALVYRVCVMIFAQHHQLAPRPTDPAPASDSCPQAPGLQHAHQPAWTLRTVGLAVWSVVLGCAMTWPVGAPWLLAGLVAYGVSLYYRPVLCLIVLPVAAAVLDWSMLTGFEAVDEFDLLALASVGSLLLGARVGAGVPCLSPSMWLILILLCLSTVLSSLFALQGVIGLADQGITAYQSEHNIFRAIKGLVLALAVFLLIPQTGVNARQAFRQYFVPGMTLGLLTVCGVVFWERATYPGLLNFESPYRISGMFTEMRVGGPSIEGFLVLTLPFALFWLWLRPGLLRSCATLVLIASGLYAVFVTYSRAGYLGVAVSSVVIASTALLAVTRGHRHAALVGVSVVLVLAGAVFGVAVQRTEGFASQRMGQIESDIDVRVAHWRHTLELVRPGVFYAVFGHGPGMYPRESRLNSAPGAIPANFAFRTDGGGTGQLVLGTGQSQYINQRLPWFPGNTVELEVRGNSDTGTNLWFFLCQKHVRHSFDCQNGRIRFPPDSDEAHTSTVTIPTGHLGQPRGFPPRHLTFAVRNLTNDSVVTLDAVHLRDHEGNELLRNADFSQGSRHWYFTTDELEAWRTENQWLELYFEQGLLGLIAFVLLTSVAFFYMLRRSNQGDFGSSIVLGSLLGVLTIGLFSTVFFSPRVMLLFYLTLLFGAISTSRHPKVEASSDKLIET